MKSFIVIGLLTLLLTDHVLGHGCGCGAGAAPSTTTSKMSSAPNEYHLTPTDDSAWSSLFPERERIITTSSDDDSEEKFKWMMRYRRMKNNNYNDDDGDFLKEVSLHDVRLDPESEHGQAQRTNLEYLLMLEVNNLIWSFRQTAGLPTPGRPYGGWEAPDVQLRGHFVGHYLSASAQMWASTHNDTLLQKMSAVVSALSDCQDKIGTGYLSAFPTDFFDRLENLDKVWAPYYTIHKIMAGLLDQHLLAGNEKALTMMTRMVDYFYHRIQNVILKYTIQRHWQYSTNVETGGMNDVLYQLYRLTGDKKHLLMAQLFDRPYFQGALALKADDLSRIHANTHIPIIVGSQMRYEITGDPIYKEIPTYFMDTVNSSYSYATGGTSVDEYWSYPKRIASTLQTENQESCTTYNMLKVSRNLFRWTKEMAYADYYEKALTNGVLGIQRGREPGVMIYMLPMGRGVSKANTENRWGDPFGSFWCCYGTGIESFSKLGDSIYFLEDGDDVPGVYVIQYISSSLNWTAGQMVLTQKVEPVASWDGRLRVILTVSSSSSHEQRAGESSLHLRIPTYSKGANALLNGKSLSLPGPGNFLTVTRKWNPNDTITLELPLSLRTEAIKDDRPGYASLHALLYGPYVLAGLSSGGDWDISRSPTPDSLLDFIFPVPPSHHSHLISLSQQSGKTSTLVLSNYNSTIAMEEHPKKQGTDAAVHATFRLVLHEPTNSSAIPKKPRDFVGKSVLLEPIDFPGALLAHQGEDRSLVVVNGGGGVESVFRLVPGLDGRKDSVSLESVSQEGCFVYSGVVTEPGTFVTLSCRKIGYGFTKGASFEMNDGLSRFHPISFVARGVERDFFLAPLFSLRDESYTVYFNFTSSNAGHSSL